MLILRLVGNARVAGLDVTLGLSDAQYNMCLTIFFFPYALFEVSKTGSTPSVYTSHLSACFET